MKINLTSLSGVVTVDGTPSSDSRGTFSRLYCDRDLAPVIGNRKIAQINRSMTKNAGAVRGLHFQRPPHAEMKLVRCIRGRVWDVAVDLRSGSPTFLRWHAEELSSRNERMLVIPEGCAHGFQVLDSESELLYLHTAFYTPEAEGGVACDDPRLGIAWPLPISDRTERDLTHAPIAPEYSGIVL